MKMPSSVSSPTIPNGAAIELHFLFELCVRRVIARENFDRAIGDSFQERVDIAPPTAVADSSCNSYRNSESPHPSARCDADKFRR